MSEGDGGAGAWQDAGSPAGYTWAKRKRLITKFHLDLVDIRIHDARGPFAGGCGAGTVTGGAAPPRGLPRAARPCSCAGHSQPAHCARDVRVVLVDCARIARARSGFAPLGSLRWAVTVWSLRLTVNTPTALFVHLASQVLLSPRRVSVPQIFPYAWDVYRKTSTKSRADRGPAEPMPVAWPLKFL